MNEQLAAQINSQTDHLRIQTMSEELDSLECMLSEALQEALFERADCFE